MAPAGYFMLLVPTLLALLQLFLPDDATFWGIVGLIPLVLALLVWLSVLSYIRNLRLASEAVTPALLAQIYAEMAQIGDVNPASHGWAAPGDAGRMSGRWCRCSAAPKHGHGMAGR